MAATFEILGRIGQVEIIARGTSIQSIGRLRALYGPANWRKLKGVAQVRFEDGTIWTAEIHWYESHGIGRKELKIKEQWRE